MSTESLLLIALAALLAFWVLGAHNRLVALRNGIIAAWAQVDEPLQRRAAALAPLVAGLRDPLDSEHGTLDAVLAAQAQMRYAADALRAHPARASCAAALATAEAALAAALARLLALLDHHRELAAADDVAPHLAALREATQRLGFARQLFNDAVRHYNEAVQQFPTRLLKHLFGFDVAGAL